MESKSEAGAVIQNKGQENSLRKVSLNQFISFIAGK